jgi:hypothetical protein
MRLHDLPNEWFTVTLCHIRQDAKLSALKATLKSIACEPITQSDQCSSNICEPIFARA